jgi:hypothetical protein
MDASLWPTHLFLLAVPLLFAGGAALHYLRGRHREP